MKKIDNTKIVLTIPQEERHRINRATKHRREGRTTIRWMIMGMVPLYRTQVISILKITESIMIQRWWWNKTQFKILMDKSINRLIVQWQLIMKSLQIINTNLIKENIRKVIISMERLRVVLVLFNHTSQELINMLREKILIFKPQWLRLLTIILGTLEATILINVEDRLTLMTEKEITSNTTKTVRTLWKWASWVSIINNQLILK